MSENDFWIYLDKLLEKGRAQQVIGSIGGADFPGYAYPKGHAWLPKDYDKISKEEIAKMGELLLFKEASFKVKEAIMMILAHQPSEAALTYLAKYALSPDRGLEFFAQMALEECAMWNE